MLNKIVAIVNVGKFRSCTAAGDVAFRKTTLIFAENGQGKTTLCDILRSLQSGDPAPVRGRATLGAAGRQTVEILVDGSRVTFGADGWSSNYPELAIYDSKFIHENVYTGDFVTHDQRRNLHRVILGERGVALARKVDDLDDQIRTVNREISEAQSAVQSFIPGNELPLDEFLKLDKVDDIDEQVSQAEREMYAVQRSAELAAKPAPSTIPWSAFPMGFEVLLSRSLEAVAEEAERQVQTHMAEHMTRRDERWINEGLQLIRDELCPFCEQSLKNNSLIGAYKTHFAAEYRRLNAEVISMKSAIASFADEATIVRIEHVLNENQNAFDYWAEFLDLDRPALPSPSLREGLEQLHRVATSYMEKKSAHPLEGVTVGSDFTKALDEYQEIKKIVVEYNATVASAAGLIEKRKREATSGNLRDVERRLTRLRATKRRHEERVDRVCSGYRESITKKSKLESAKQKAKQDLDEYGAAVMSQYEARINELLAIFGAGFRIENTSTRYVGGTPSSTYQIAIESHRVDLGDAGTPWSVPSFKNTLSAGDKSTLGLAFFLAQLQQSPNLDTKVVVFDDPFTSQDRSRRTCTQQQICRLSRSASQVIVLSHDGTFLKLICDELPSGDVKSLQLARMGKNTTLTQWDIEDQVRGDYFKNYALLQKYRDQNEGDPRHVARTIRPVLEAYLKFKLPGQFGENQWLGDFIRAIREADEQNPVAAARQLLEDLEDVNNYSKRYHHSENPGADNESIDEGELLAYVRRALDIVGGF